MTTSISVQRTEYEAQDRSWLDSPHGTDPGTTRSISLDLTTFTLGTHYPKGSLLPGIVLGRITASGLYGPYDSAASDGRQTAKGLLFSGGRVDALNLAKPVGSALFVHGFVNPARLPVQSGVGALSVAARTALRLIYFADE